ncbi:transient receptor potential cation channel protein painless-like isoform X2 [Periplaneta americana]
MMPSNNKENSYQQILLKHLEDKDIKSFAHVLERRNIYDIDPNFEYGDPHFKNCLSIAAQKGLVEFVNILLQNGAQPNEICKYHDGNAAIHFAAKEGRLDVLKLLVKYSNINAVNRQGNTALHIAAHKSEDCFSYLLTLPEIRISQRNLQRQTATKIAVRNCSKETLANLVNRSDLSSEDKIEIINKYPDLRNELTDTDTTASYTHPEAYLDLCGSDNYIEEFKSNFNQLDDDMKKEFVNKTDFVGTLLQIACEKGLIDIVKLLVKCGAEVNTVGKHTVRPPVHLACYFGKHDVLRHLVENSGVKNSIVEGQNLLHAVLQGLSTRRKDENQYRLCFDYLLQNLECLEIPINQGENSGHTALHFAVQEKNTYYTKALLARGAYIGALNEFGISPLNDMEPAILEDSLDDCIEYEKESKGNEHHIKVNFSILKPYVNSDSSEQNSDEELGNAERETLPEMYPLYYISQSYKLGHLLKHPVLLLFLHLKWNRICLVFYLNILYYLIFVVLLTVDILNDHSLCSTCEENSCNSESSLYKLSGIRFVIFVLFLILIIRETVQFFMAPQRRTFFLNLENWLELGIIVTISLIISGHCTKLTVAILLLLAWAEVILQFGCIYTLAIYNEMMKRVTLNYMKFLAWYGPLIIAFTFSFFVLYHNETPNEGQKEFMSSLQNCSNSSGENEVDFYSYIPLTLVKTVVMMIGEFDASSMSFNNGGYFIFLLFVFVMTIVLVNLLNGLAVSDTQAIRDNAELVTYRSKVKLVHRFESVIACPLVSSFSKISSCCSCSYKLIGVIPCSWRERILKRICLFPDVLAEDSLSIIINHGVRYIDRQLKTEEIEFRPDTSLSIGKFRMGFELNRKVIELIKDILDRKVETQDYKDKELLDRISKIEYTLQQTVTLLEQVIQKTSNFKEINES